MTGTTTTPGVPPDVQDAYDAWLDESPHSILLMSIGDECWRSIAYDAAFAAYQAGRQVAITKTWNTAQAAQRELIRRRLAEHVDAARNTWDGVACCSAVLLADLLGGAADGAHTPGGAT